LVTFAILPCLFEMSLVVWARVYNYQHSIFVEKSYSKGIEHVIPVFETLVRISNLIHVSRRIIFTFCIGLTLFMFIRLTK